MADVSDKTAGAFLPDVLPIFPLAGVLLLPGGKLPLHVFERRYRAMTNDALAGHRLIGIVQPRVPEAASAAGSVGNRDAVYATGCAGRITDFTETPDGRYLITLTGISRFRVTEELAIARGYRRVKPDWEPFAGDLAGMGDTAETGPLLDALEAFFGARGVVADWAEIRRWPETTLVSTMAMICPFDAHEKQALLECTGLRERAELLMTLMEMAAYDGGDGGAQARH